jgi:hypothetical protein
MNQEQLNCICGNFKFACSGAIFGIFVLADGYAIVAEGQGITCACHEDYFAVDPINLFGCQFEQTQLSHGELIFRIESHANYTVGCLSPLQGRTAEGNMSLITTTTTRPGPAFELAAKRVCEVKNSKCPLCEQSFGWCGRLSPGLVHTQGDTFMGQHAVLGYPTSCDYCGISFFLVYMDEWAGKKLKDAYPGKNMVPFPSVMFSAFQLKREGQKLNYSFYFAVSQQHHLFLSEIASGKEKHHRR